MQYNSNIKGGLHKGQRALNVLSEGLCQETGSRRTGKEGGNFSSATSEPGGRLRLDVPMATGFVILWRPHGSPLQRLRSQERPVQVLVP